MVHPNTKLLRAIGTMIGGIVGVGVFGLPFAFAQTGFAVGLITLIIMGALLTVLQLMFAEITLQTPGRHRMVGYIRRYISPRWGWVALVTMTAMFWGTQIAYIIVGGRFLHILISPVLGGPEILYSIVLWAIASYLIYRGLQFASKAEVFIISALLTLFAFIVLAAAPHIEVGNLFTLDINTAFVAYGVVLFSLAGLGVVPEMKDILGKKQEKKLPKAILVAMAVIGLIYTLFPLAVVGVTGAGTTEIAFDGLIPVLGTPFLIIGSLLGSLTILSIFTIVGIQLMNTLKYDFDISHKKAWTLTSFVPIILFLLGIRQFIELIGFIGGVLAALIGVLIVLSYEQMRRGPECRGEKCFSVPPSISWIIIGIFIFGAVLEVIGRIV